MSKEQKSSELREAFREQMPVFRRAMFFTVLANLLSLAPIGYMRDVYGPVINSRSMHTLLMVTVVMVGALCMSGLLEWVRSRMLAKAALAVNEKLGKRVFDASFAANLRMSPPGARQALHDLRGIRAFLMSQAAPMLMDAPVSLFFLLLVFLINPRMGIIATLAAIIMFAIGYSTEKAVRKEVVAANKSATRAQNYIASSARNALVVEAMGMLSKLQGHWRKYQHDFLGRQAIASEKQAGSRAVSKFVMLSQGSVILGFGCLLTLEGLLPPDGGAMIIASILGGRAVAPLLQVIGSWKQIVTTRESFYRLEAFLEASAAQVQTMDLPAPEGALSVQGLMAYAPGTRRTVLQNLSFDLPAGQALAVVGPSGSGKSSLTRLLVGVWSPTVGNVRLDGADVSSWDKTKLGPYLGYLPQEIELFDGTVAQNIARFGELNAERIEDAARLVGLHEFILGLPNGYETEIGDDGAFLSGGQRQRIGLARAIYGEPKLVVLDEPNSNLDKEGDLALVGTMQALRKRGCTVVVVTHRKNLLPLVDRMLVLKNGQPKVFGPRDKVLAKLAGKDVKTVPASKVHPAQGATAKAGG